LIRATPRRILVVDHWRESVVFGIEWIVIFAKIVVNVVFAACEIALASELPGWPRGVPPQPLLRGWQVHVTVHQV